MNPGSAHNHVSNINNLMMEILSHRSEIETTGMGYMASDKEKLTLNKVDQIKTKILSEMRILALQFKYPYEIPDGLSAGFVGTTVEANQRPR